LDRRLNFSEFIISLWNYLSFSSYELVEFFFHLYDADMSGHLSPDECKFMVGVIWKFNTEGKLKVVMEEFDKNGDDSISLDELKKTAKRFDSLFFPAFEMQYALRQSTLGESRWEEIYVDRKARFGDKDAYEILRDYGYYRPTLVQNSLRIIEQRSHTICPSLEKRFVESNAAKYHRTTKRDIQGLGDRLLKAKNGNDVHGDNFDTAGNKGHQGDEPVEVKPDHDCEMVSTGKAHDSVVELYHLRDSKHKHSENQRHDANDAPHAVRTKPNNIQDNHGHKDSHHHNDHHGHHKKKVHIDH
jgi:Ca2+-binding EF-hand superfamily protein